MRKLVWMGALAASAAASTACGPRRVEVTAAQPTAAAVQLAVTNTLSQPVNIYVVHEGTDTFVRQVAANASETVGVRGVPSGATVTLRAVPVDGRNTYTRQDVVLSGTYSWRLP
ncbi:MAG: hypothetical protein AVDCRST_MAG40-3222 [uncultured Gemmatimonadaceae bacterium]|uniref:Uncharacterized protein n=1 Tax=uncultured Gemmatimonadaceae bacterium TaxID=246130 RepID=A0A6J4MFG2_9BACT|nr:MAG: hypothetical protein AVDCRST_MAG40-3222 [uncultured Gemmatimonadaceae bacterium]